MSNRRLQFKYVYLNTFKARPTGIDVLDKVLSSKELKGRPLTKEELNLVITNFTGQDGEDLWKSFLELDMAKDIFNKEELQELKGYFSREDDSLEMDNNTEEIQEPIKVEENVKSDRKNINLAQELFGASIDMLVIKILEGYTRLFESGFQLKRPTGILGDGVLYSLSGNTLVESKLDAVARAGKSLIIENLGLTVCEERSVNKIANIILTGKASKDDPNPPRTGKLYFPLKMIEFAYGREQSSSENINGKTNYGNVSKYTKWSDYSKYEIKPVLVSIFTKVAELLTQDLDENITFEEESKIKEKLNSLVEVFLTCVVISEHNAKKPDILRIKAYDPNQKLLGNVATDIALKAYGSDGGNKGISQAPIVDGDFYEYVHEIDHILYNAEPLFAYKAADALKAQGKPINMDNMLIGLQNGSTILPIGSGGINLTSNLTHGFIAGSRAGKGLQTLLLLANWILSRKAVFYLDNKPDMASLIKYLCSDAFVVNGGNITTNKADGTDYFEQFVNPNRFIRQDTPEYVKRQFGSSYNSLGNFYYARALILVMSIIALRVEAPEILDKLGGEEGIMIVVDELANASDGLNNLMQFKGLTNIARTGFYNEYIEYLVNKQNYPILLEEWESNGSKGTKPKEPKEPKMKPDKGAYWFSAFYKSLADSIVEIQRLDKAGLRNSEVRKSDVFVLSQILHEPSSDVSQLFARRNKESNNPSVSILKNDVLASMCMVGNTDGFIGYNAGKPNYLGQGNSSSKSFGKLDQYARNFAYVESIVGDGKKQIEGGSLSYAEHARYYKPFLMFADGEENGYFVQNAFKYAKAAGIETEDLIARNEDPVNKGHLDKRVGFKEYLLDNGMSEDLIKEVLSKSAIIANFVVKEVIGYSGNWSDFIFDLRPEWIISIDQIVNAYKNKGLLNVKERLNEFTAIYPEEFGLDPENILPREVEDENFDNDLFLEDMEYSGNNSEFVDKSVDDVVNNFKDEVVYTPENQSLSSVVNSLDSSEDLLITPETKIVFSKGEIGVKSLIEFATANIVEMQGGNWGIETFEDINGRLRINGAVVKIALDESQLVNLPHHYKRRVLNNLWGELFDYSKMKNFSNMRELSLFNKYSLKELAVICGASSRITDADGWFFDNFNSLRKITTESGTFTRGSTPEGSKISYSQNASGKVADFCSDLRKSSWGYTKEVATRKDLGIVSKIFLGTLSGVFGAGVGVAEGTIKTTKGIRNWINALKDVSGGK